ncbi:AtpZ/AtpI family protein [Campylobacter sp. FMV-PI01]|uniref:AtpZ/AtpI family protein n=1 Tax=Campylobacter portucalensis TaxID=2608384 RepID=A0A6L5WHR4_9BACT|nr:AtpZ/AtpI family protein [Campylobacter portucalensis]MSN96730.1 AtpZ/AtpI family protein [Campylobacter portucalensis]
MKITKNLNDVAKSADGLSLVISVVVAILIGVGLGNWIVNLTGIKLFFWIFLFVGIAAGFLNIYKAFKSQQKDLKDLESDIKYQKYKELLDSKKKDDWADDEWDKEDRKWD